MDISIIIVNYKTPQLVIDCVKSICEKTKDISYEIIVVDNDSQDNSKNIICTELNNKIRYVQSNVNLGFGKANNLGAKYATGKYLFLLNSDTLLVNNAIKELFDFIEKHDNCGIVGGNLFTVDMKPNPSYSMIFDNIQLEKSKSRWINIIKEIFLRKLNQFSKKNVNNLEVFNKDINPKKVGYIFGTDLMMKKSLFDELNGFDKDFFMYAEEEELSYRVIKKGYEIWNVPSARIIHYDGASTKKDDTFNKRSYQMRMTSLLIYYDKTFGTNGGHLCYKYRNQYFERVIKLSKLLNRKLLFNLTVNKKSCLDEVYKLYCEESK